jgi:hypothetical protein
MSSSWRVCAEARNSAATWRRITGSAHPVHAAGPPAEELEALVHVGHGVLEGLGVVQLALVLVHDHAQVI